MLNATWRFIGRLLITAILFTVAFEKLQHPEMYKLDFTRAVANLDGVTSRFGLSLTSLQSNALLLIKLSGLLDALIAALIMLGNSKGGRIAVVRYVVALLAYYLPWSASLVKTYTQRERLANNIGLLGVALLLTQRN